MKTLVRSMTCLLIPVLLVTVSCGQGKKGAAAGMSGPGGKGGPAMVKEYNVMAVNEQSTTLFKDYPVVLEGQQTVEIRPKIAGYIEQILVDEGAHVRKGQVLFRLNDKDLQATVRSAEARVKVAEADVYSAKINLEKTKPLVEKSIISTFDLQSVESTLRAKEAQLAQSKADLENARENLQYSSISSPTEGTIGTFPYRIGSLVNSGIAEPLATVSNTSRVYGYFSLNEKDFFTLINGLEGQSLQDKFKKLPAVQLILADGSVYDQPGRIETASGLVDQKTGSVTMRASFPNAGGMLKSGGSGQVRIPRQIDSAIIIPQSATYDLQGKRFVYVVTTDNKAHATEIQVLVGNLKNTCVVTGGLNVGDKIVLEGIISLRNDTEIKPKLVEAPDLSENAASAAEAPASPGKP